MFMRSLAALDLQPWTSTTPKISDYRVAERASVTSLLIGSFFLVWVGFQLRVLIPGWYLMGIKGLQIRGPY